MTSYLSINTKGHDEVDLDHQRRGVHVQDLMTEMKVVATGTLQHFSLVPEQ